MNVSKAMVKVDLAKSLGKQYAGMVEEAEKSELRQEGAKDGLKEAAQKVGDLGLQLDKALEDGELSAADLKDPKKVEAFIKIWNRRAVGVLDNLATKASMAQVQANGRTKGLRAAEEHARKMAENEMKRLEELHRQIERGEITIEDVESGGHPGLSLKHQREDEGAAKAEVASEPASEEPKPQAKKSVAKAPKKRPKKKPTPKGKKGPAPKKG